MKVYVGGKKIVVPKAVQPQEVSGGLLTWQAFASSLLLHFCNGIGNFCNQGTKVPLVTKVP